MRLLYLTIAVCFFYCSPITAQTDGQNLAFRIKSPSDISGIYPHRGATDFGGNIEETICGEIFWAGEIETLGCESIEADLSGKIVLIRRGVCFFSEKVFYAQEAGAIAVIIASHDQDPDIGLNGVTGMQGGDLASDVTIPSIFVSFNTGETLASKLDVGDPIEVSISLNTFYNEHGPYSYSTPINQVIAMEDMSVVVFNPDKTDGSSVEIKLEITNPSGETTEIVTTGDFALNADPQRVSFDSYLPEEIGVYDMVYSSGLDGREIKRKFEITEYTWATDSGIPSRAVGDSTGFTDGGFFYQQASLVLTGEGGIATHVTFGLGNGEDLFTGESNADLILFAIYNADLDGDGIIDEISSFDDLGNPLEVGLYEIQGDETFDKLITAPLLDPYMLEPDGLYYVSVAYDGLDAGTGVQPDFSATRAENYFAFTTPVQINGFFNGGWSGLTAITRLHLEGFISGTKDIQPLSSDKLKILSNPVVNDLLNFELTLAEVNDNVNVLFRNLEGKLINHLPYQNVQNVSEQINVRGLPSGTYFLNINTDEGFRSEKIVIAN